MQELYGIIGHPLGHSLSPQLFGAIFAQERRQAAYFRWDVRPEDVGGFMEAVRILGIRGASVTLPHKQAVIPFLDVLSQRAALAGAVNTLYWDEGRLCGENTDIAGFLEPLQTRSFRRALVIGSGGVSRAVLAGLRERKAEIFVTARSEEKAGILAEDFNVQLVPWKERAEAALSMDLLINATPIGMQGEYENLAPISFIGAPAPGSLAYDLIYIPRPTRFLREAAAVGWDIQDGLAMFLAQAQAQFHLWTGRAWTRENTCLARETLERALSRN